MIRTEHFYSLKDWQEYALAFMSKAAIKVSNDCCTVITEKGQTLGKWKADHGILFERRDTKRLSEIKLN